MSKLLITGGSGFIGGRFAELHRDKFDSINALGRKMPSSSLDRVSYHSIDIDETEKIRNVAKDVQHIVNVAYDKGNPTKNLRALQNLISLCTDLKIRSLIHMSSFVVYDPDLAGDINEDSRWSTIKDPYTRVKQESELLLMKAVSQGLNVTIIQPTVVYGMLGNWTLHAAKSIASGKLVLPAAGRTVCNAVHVDDVAESILLAINTNDVAGPGRMRRYLISGKRSTTWKEFYGAHQNLVGTEFTVEELDNNGRYSSSTLEQIIYRMLFSGPGFTLLGRAIPLLRSFIKSNRSPGSLSAMVDQGRAMSSFIPKGMNRVYHSSMFVTSIKKAADELGYVPKKDISGFPAEIKASMNK